MSKRTISHVIDPNVTSHDTAANAPKTKRLPGHGVGPEWLDSDEDSDEEDIKKQPWPPTSNNPFAFRY